MVESNAEKFIREIARNHDLRRSFYTLEGTEEIKEALREAGYCFRHHEFEDTINNLKTRCATEEDAVMLDELLIWWQMLLPCSPASCTQCSSCG